MRKHIRFRLFFLFSFIPTFILSSLSSLSGAQSTPWEYYSKYKVIVPFSWSGRAIKLIVNEEARFKQSYRYYNKIPVGLSTKVNKHWEVGLFYALREKKNESHWDIHHLIWPEAVYRTVVNPIVIDDRQRFELHLTDRDQRYRNFLRIKFSTLKGKLIPWGGDEIRYFFKRAQFAMNEIFAGLMSKPNHHFTINLYYDYRLIRNKRNFWEKANVFQSMIIYQF